MGNELKKIARDVLEDYDASKTHQVERDSENAVILTPQLARAFPVFSFNCPYGPHQYHLNSWINGKRDYLKVFNAQEANALRPLYALDNAQMILGELEKFSLGGREGFLTDTPDNGFVTVYLGNFGNVSGTRERLAQRAREQANSKIKTLAQLTEDVRQGFYWQNIPQEVIGAGKAFEESRRDWAERRADIGTGMERFLTENPEAFRKYFNGLVNFVNGCSRTIEDVNSRNLSRFPSLMPVQGEESLRQGDYIQGRFFVPEEGWVMLHGEFSGLTSLEVEDKKIPAISLINYSPHADHFSENKIVAVSDIAQFGNSIWRLE